MILTAAMLPDFKIWWRNLRIEQLEVNMAHQELRNAFLKLPQYDPFGDDENTDTVEIAMAKNSRRLKAEAMEVARYAADVIREQRRELLIMKMSLRGRAWSEPDEDYDLDEW